MKELTATNLCKTVVAAADLMASVMLDSGPISCSKTELLASSGEPRKGLSSMSSVESWARLVTSSSGEWDMCCGGKKMGYWVNQGMAMRLQ